MANGMVAHRDNTSGFKSEVSGSVSLKLFCFCFSFFLSSPLSLSSSLVSSVATLVWDRKESQGIYGSHIAEALSSTMH